MPKYAMNKNYFFNINNNSLKNNNMATEITKEYNMDYHLNTIKETLDYINNDRRKRNRSGEGIEKLDSMIHDLTKVVRLIKGLKEEKS